VLLWASLWGSEWVQVKALELLAQKLELELDWGLVELTAMQKAEGLERLLGPEKEYD
jgi:hypothetical protein